MHYAVELFLDRKTTTLIRVIWHKTEEFWDGPRMDESGQRPHITMSGFRDADTGQVTAQLRKFAKQTPPFTVSFASLGTFSTQEGVVFLAPVMTRELLLMHEYLHRNLKGKITRVDKHYTPANWVPHCTIAYGLDRKASAKVVGMFSRKALPINALVEKIALVDTQTQEIRCQYPLTGDELELNFLEES